METKGKHVPQTLCQDAATGMEGQLFCVEGLLSVMRTFLVLRRQMVFIIRTVDQARCSSASCVHLTCDSHC